MSSNTDHGHHFIVPLKYYIGTFVALLILTVLTVAVSRVDLGFLNDPVAVGIAIVKASLVLLFFMGMRWEKGISGVLVIGSFIAVIIFFLFTFTDVGFRGTIYKSDKGVHGLKTPVKPISADDAHKASKH
ncbi:oxidase [Candidatus Marinamargulisbacteria bacterium SCGC AG-439-L15]|nr:oxidase [Candidatus Marinamargulisbacteria bacterium SCGC AG-439-L15]